MFNFESLHLGLAYPSYVFFILLLIIAGYAYYVYRYTVPAIPAGRKSFLVILRTLALLLLLFVFFEPILSITTKKILKPLNLIFLDNSRSMKIDDGTDRAGTVKDFASLLEKSGIADNSLVYSFGTNLKTVDKDSLQLLNFSEGGTNYTQVFNEAGKTGRNISSIVLVSDGDITEGSDPIYDAEKLGIPVYTVGVGDTAQRNDISVKNVLYNRYIYAGTPTEISASIINTGFAGQNLLIKLNENNKTLDQKTVTLDKSGIQNVSFTYLPKKSGEKKLSIEAAGKKGEFTFSNNKKVFYINILSTKIKILLLAGSPSSDLTFIKTTLKEDKNLDVHSLTQVAAGRFIEKNDPEKLIDSADIYFLIGFPGHETPADMLSKVKRQISQKDKPFFISLSPGVDFNKLKSIQTDLPFITGNVNSDFLEVQPDISADQADNPLLQNNAASPLAAWNNLPPVYQPNVKFDAKAESKVIASVRVNNAPINRPLILTRRLGAGKSIAVLARDIWRWKLETAPQNLDLFDRFILSSVKWLNAKDNDKQVTIKTGKKLYSLGEPVEFNAQVYDQTFNPVNSAQVTVNVKSDSGTTELTLNPLGNGLYSGTLQTNKTGDYTFSGSALLNKNKLGSDNGKFNIGEVDIETINPIMNYEYLSLLSRQTGGKFYYNRDFDPLFKTLKNLNDRSVKEKLDITETTLWSDKWLMAAAIILFALEWFFRKRWGML